MPKFTLPASTLVAINKYATSTESTRYYLNGVCIDVSEGRGFMVATDGHKLLCAPFDTDEPDGSYIIPRGLIAKLKTARKSEPTVDVEISGSLVTLSFDGGIYGDQLIDGSFPDWRRVIPSEISGGVARFNGAYLKDLDDAGKLAEAGRATVGYNGDGPAWVGFADSEKLFGVIMPIRMSAPIKPSWL